MSLLHAAVMVDDPKTLALRWFDEVWNHGSTGTVRELMSPDARGWSEAGSVHGPEEFINLVHAPMSAVFTDLKLTVEDAIAEGDQVVVRWIVTAAPSGELVPHPAGGARFSFCGMTWLKFRDGKIIEGWDRFNLHALNAYLATGEASATVYEVGADSMA